MENENPTRGLQRAGNYIHEHFESLFILVTLVAVVLINFFTSQKLAFLDFFFLPIILAGYYLGQRKAVMGAVLSLLYIVLYVVYSPESFITDTTTMTLYLRVASWGGFLILSGAVVGGLHGRLKIEMDASHVLVKNLSASQQELHRANEALEERSKNLEVQTQELQESKRSIEMLKTKVEETLYATMDSSVAKLVIEGRLRDEKREVSVMFADIVGFTSYSEEHPPEVVISELNRYLRAVEPILLSYRGHIDKYMGDAIMCEFGAPEDYETYRLHGVIAGLKLQEHVKKANYPWQLRVGIASGSTITGLIGTKRRTYTAIGDSVNTASRLERSCSPGSVLIDRYTNDGICHFIETRRKLELTKDSNAASKERELEEILVRLKDNDDGAAEHYEAGQIYLSLGEPAEALSHFGRALQRNRENDKYKLAYAEAGIQVSEQEGITIRGKRNRVEAYEVIKLKDTFQDRKKIPQTFYNDFKFVENLIQIPADVTLPVEVLDGSIGHSKVVAILSYALAGQLDVPETEKMNILQAGFAADIGKEIVPYHLLHRRGSLTPREMLLVQQHPMESTRLLKTMGYTQDSVIQMVLHSHEHFNGSGYPNGLSGNAIPIGSRVIAVADAYDALTSRRPHRDAWERSAALTELQYGVERGLYDPEVVQTLVGLVGGAS
jgi:HD-GYP domain-containing protein (c-di-GMP phosphodiesterase class II)/class 3 adenylate cyclase